MAVTNTYETFEGRTGSDDSKLQVSLVRSFIVQTDDVTDDVPSLFGTNLPALFSQHPTFERAWCIGRTASQMEDPYFWKVTCSYSSNIDTVAPSSTPSAPQTPEVANQNKGASPEEKASEENLNPLTRPTDVDYSTADKEFVLMDDFSDPQKPILNGNGERFDPPVMAVRPVIAMKLEYNAATFSALEWMARVKCVNTAAFQGFAARTILLDKVSAKRVYESGYKYWRMSLEFMLDQNTWDAVVLNHSYTEWNGTKLIRAVDIAGKDLPNGVIIMGNTGIPLDHGDDPTEGNGGYLRFRIYEDISFAWLLPIYRKIL
jgi:hypothetical protein